MAVVMILGLAASSIPFFIVFLVKICGETSRMTICKVVRVDSEPSSAEYATAGDEQELEPQPVISAEESTERKLIEMSKRVA